MGQRSSQPTPPAPHEPATYLKSTAWRGNPKDRSVLWSWIPRFGHRTRERDLERGDEDVDTGREERDVAYPAKFVRVRDEEWQIGFVEHDFEVYGGLSGHEIVGFPLIDNSRTAQQIDVRQERSRVLKELRSRYNDDEWSLNYVESHGSQRSG